LSEEFFRAISDGDLAQVRKMLAVDFGLAQTKDENGLSPLLKAAYYRKKEVVDLLLGAGVELSIFEAAATGQTARVRDLLKQDSSLVNSFAPDGFTALGLAVFFGHRETVGVLLDAGADVDLPSRESMKVTPLQSAAAAQEVEIARLLIKRGANVNASQVEGGFTPLHSAAANGNVEFARLLLESGADLNPRMSDGKTPLGVALEHNQSAMTALLQGRGGVS